MNTTAKSSLYTNRFTFREVGNPLALPFEVIAADEKSARRSLSETCNYEVVAVAPVPYLYGERAACVACELSALTGKTWTSSPSIPDSLGTAFDLVCVDAAEVPLWLDLFADAYRRKGRGRAVYERPRSSSGEWVSVYGGNGTLPDPSITFDLTKPDAAVAKDIARRLLPAARELHEKVLRRVEQVNDYAARCVVAAQVAKELRHAAGVGFTASGAEVKLSGYLTPTQARAVHAALSALPASEG